MANSLILGLFQSSPMISETGTGVVLQMHPLGLGSLTLQLSFLLFSVITEWSPSVAKRCFRDETRGLHLSIGIRTNI